VIAGQTFMGVIEQRIRQLLLNLDADKHVLWYIPDFPEMYYAGRLRYSPVGLLDGAAGGRARRLRVLGESGPPRWRRSAAAPAAAPELKACCSEHLRRPDPGARRSGGARAVRPAGVSVEPVVRL
jgi:hypothetical protein